MRPATEQKILDYAQAAEAGRRLSGGYKKLVMVSGCFDLPHLGHVEFLSDARALGDALVIALGPDHIIKQLKGPARPIMPHDYRAKMLAAFEVVDFVVIADEPLQMPGALHFEKLIDAMRPAIFAINSFNGGVEQKRRLIESYGGKLVTVEGRPLTSTTEIIGKIEKIL